MFIYGSLEQALDINGFSEVPESVILLSFVICFSQTKSWKENYTKEDI